jgi:hypothetical protein
LLKLKREGSEVQDSSNEHPKKKCHLTLPDDDNMTFVRHGIADIKETLVEMASEAREDRRNIINKLEDLDIPHIKEIINEAREERDNIYYMLVELLTEIQRRA